MKHRFGGFEGPSTDELDKSAIVSIREWKIYKALYEKYGGRVIFQQLGCNPIGAIEAFAREQQKNGNLKIFDPKYAEQFWAELSFPEISRNKRISLNKKEVDEYYSKPWWLWTPEEEMKFQGGPQ